MDINKSSLSSIAPFKTPPLRTAALWYWALEVYQSSFLSGSDCWGLVGVSAPHAVTIDTSSAASLPLWGGGERPPLAPSKGEWE